MNRNYHTVTLCLTTEDYYDLLYVAIHTDPDVATPLVILKVIRDKLLSKRSLYVAGRGTMRGRNFGVQLQGWNWLNLLQPWENTDYIVAVAPRTLATD